MSQAALLLWFLNLWLFSSYIFSNLENIFIPVISCRSYMGRTSFFIQAKGTWQKEHISLKAHLYGAGISHSLGCHFSPLYVLKLPSRYAVAYVCGSGGQMLNLNKDQCSSREHCTISSLILDLTILRLFLCGSLSGCQSLFKIALFILFFFNKNVYLKDIPVQ